MKGVKELWECGDPILERDATYVMTAVAGNLELVGGEADTLIDMYLTGQQPNVLRMVLLILYKFCHFWRVAKSKYWLCEHTLLIITSER